MRVSSKIYPIFDGDPWDWYQSSAQREVRSDLHPAMSLLNRRWMPTGLGGGDWQIIELITCNRRSSWASMFWAGYLVYPRSFWWSPISSFTEAMGPAPKPEPTAEAAAFVPVPPRIASSVWLRAFAQQLGVPGPRATASSRPSHRPARRTLPVARPKATTDAMRPSDPRWKARGTAAVRSVRRRLRHSSAASAFTAASASLVMSSSATYISFTAALSCLLSSSNLRALEKAATVPKPVMP